MTSPIRYQVVYKNGDKTLVAEFQRNAEGRFVFEYITNPKYEFPGFDVHIKKHASDTLWEQIAFRVPNLVRDEYRGTPLEELLRYTNGQLVTDHFEFLLVPENGKNP